MWFGRRTMRSEKLRQRKRRTFLTYLIAFGAVFVVLCGAAIWFLYQPAFHISEIVVNGNRAVSDEEVQGVVNEKILGKYFFIFPRRNSLIYPEREVEAALLSSFTRIESIDLVRTGFHTLTVEVREQEPFALWCMSGAAESPEETCYFLNYEGLAFSKAPNFTGNVFFKFYDGRASGDPIGSTYFETSEQFGRMTLLTEALAETGLEPVSFHPLEEGDAEIRLAESAKLIITQSQSSSEIVANLEAILKSESFKETSLDSIEYIDLRFGNRIYFKVKE